MSIYPNSAMNEPIPLAASTENSDSPSSIPADVTLEPTEKGNDGSTAADPAGLAVDPAAAVADFAPDNIKAMRAESPSMFSADTTFLQELPNPIGLEPEHAAAVGRELRMMAGDIGLSSPELRTLANLARQHEATPPTDEQLDAWQRESLQALQREFGADAHARLNEAQQLARRDTRLGPFLEQLGMADHPRVVRILIEKARSEKLKGRL